MKFARNFIVFFALFSLVNFSFCEEDVFFVDDLKFYYQGKTDFEELNYGSALKKLNAAKTERIKKNQNEIRILENALKPAEVKYAGPLISDKIPVLKEREDYDALKIISRYEKVFTLEYFEDSPEKLLDYIKKSESFPEADYLISQIYIIEGEYDIAIDYLEKAYMASDILSIPDEKYEILFSLAEIYEFQGDFNKMEEYLLLILSKEPMYRSKNRINALLKSISSPKKNCVEQFFKLYRGNNYDLLKSFFKLGKYYKKSGENEKALYTTSLGVATGFTKILNIVTKRNPVFEYKDLKSLLDEVSNYSDIVQWGIDNSLWESFNSFAECAFKNGDSVFASTLYKILSESNPEPYWREDAKLKAQDLLF